MLDLDERKKAINHLTSAWIKASAGSGKTKILVDRIIKLILEGSSPDKILAITFTNAAAEEMLERVETHIKYLYSIVNQEVLSHELSRLECQGALENYKNILINTYNNFKNGNNLPSITTIHGFGLNLLKNFALEAKINPSSKIIDYIKKTEIIENILYDMLNGDSEQPVIKAIEEISTIVSGYSFYDIAKQLFDDSDNIEYMLKLYGNIDSLLAELAIMLKISCENEQNLIERIALDKEYILLQIEIIEENGSNNDIIKATRIKKALLQNADIFEYAMCYLTSDGSPIKTIFTQKIQKKYPKEILIFLEHQEIASEFWNEYKNRRCYNNSKNIIIIANHIINLYNNYKLNHGLLDFSDLVKNSINMLNNEENAWIKYFLNNKIHHILIDEAQDTNPWQWQLILSLFEDSLSGNIYDLHRTLFIVGDEKQSIYSFQGADHNLFFLMKEFISQKFHDINQEFQFCSLTTSFRTCSNILNFIDKLFADKEVAKCLSYGEDVEIKHNPHRIDLGRVMIWPYIMYKPNEEELHWPNPMLITNHYNHAQICAKFIVGQIKEWISNARILPSQNRMVKASDIMILLPKRSELYYSIINELNRNSIPNNGVDRFDLFSQLMIKDIISLYKFVLNPDDDFNLAHLLKSPFFGIDENNLMNLCLNRGELSLWESVKDDPDYLSLTNFINNDNRHNLKIFTYNILIEQLYYSKFITRFGETAMFVIHSFLDLLDEFDGSEMHNFVYIAENRELLINLANNNQNQVRVMTIHGSKGLEANIVIIAESGKTSSNAYERLIWKNDDKPAVFFNEKQLYKPTLLSEISEKNKQIVHEEKLRLLYVALTRARDELYVIASGDDEEIADNWYRYIANSTACNEFKEYDIFSQIIEKFHLLNKKTKFDGYDYTYNTTSFDKNELISNKFDIIDIRKIDSVNIANKEDILVDNSNISMGILLHFLLQFHRQHQFQLDKIRKMITLFDDSLSHTLDKIYYILQNINDKYGELLFKHHHIVEYEVLDHNSKTIRMDNVIWLDDQNILIIDYKLSKNINYETHRQYITQLNYYKKNLSNFYPQHKIATAILWLEECEILYS